MKLYIHQRSFSEEQVIINPNDFPSICVGDFLEIFHPDEGQSHLLVQVKTLSVELPQKGMISIEQGVASLFQLRAYQTVQVNRVSPDSQDVVLDLVELVFKDQYLSRSDMWRLKSSLVGSCVYTQQKVGQCGVRAQVQELWSRGGTVSCGAITADTRLAFRSYTAMVYLLVQMSSEMWDFDTCGDLYVEKAVSGFLTELFTSWKAKGANHELSIVLFSRTYFEADSTDEFPLEMHPRLHVHEDGRHYEDYYRVFSQYERREDWMPVIAPLKVTMQGYAKDIEDWQRRVGCLQKGHNSNASQGNVLEAINLSLNVFDNHYMNRNFDRTGQLVILVTPGAGVFEVDRTLCKLSEQRMIDYGIGSDLVCLAEQPLHPVPLMKFHDTLNKSVPIKDRYHIPHWLNYSFYLSPSQKRRYQSTQTSFVSRLRLPDRIDEDLPRTQRQGPALPKIPSPSRLHGNNSRSTLGSDDSNASIGGDLADDDLTKGREGDEDEWFDSHDGMLFQRSRRRRSKVETMNNPFSPDTLSIQLTADRRRWTHTFPRGPDGEIIQPHHRHPTQIFAQGEGRGIVAGTPHSVVSQSPRAAAGNVGNGFGEVQSHPWWVRVDPRRRVGCVWGITGEQVWTPFLHSGMDWKSMITTACFPITTDFYPLRQSLDQDYQEAPYAIDIEADGGATSSQTIFQEIISQRLIQNFQLVVLPQQEMSAIANRNRNEKPLITQQNENVYVLSYASAFHKLSLKPDMSSIEVVLYTDRNTTSNPKLAYTYSLWPLCKRAYELAHTRMYHKPVEHNRWNHRDMYTSLGGMATREGFDLQECVKFWRSRYVLLPAHTTALRQMAETGYRGNMDVFDSSEASSKPHLVEGFLKFIEGVNRRRTRLNIPTSNMGSRQRASQCDATQGATSPSYRRISRSGASTPTTHHPPFALSTNATSSLLSSVVSSRRDDQQASAKDEGCPTSPGAMGDELNLTSRLVVIVKAMKDPSLGMNMIGGDQRGIPPDSFTSAEAVSWLRRRLVDQPTYAEAVAMLEVLLQEGYIYAVFSSAAAKEIIYGCYVYCIPDAASESPPFPWSPWSPGSPGRYTVGSPMYDVPPQQEWFEVACTASQDKLAAGEDKASELVCLLPVYKSIVVEMWNADFNQMEYCHTSLHGNYQPNHAFDIELQWLNSSPRLLHDMLMNWRRRAQSTGFHLVPSHVDPFCFWEDISDPFCSPVFVPLALTEGTPRDLHGKWGLLAHLQELILRRFGFLANHTSCMSPLLGSSSSDAPYLSIHVQYIHVTGSVFALPTPTQAETTLPRKEKLPCLCSTWKSNVNNNNVEAHGWRRENLLHSSQRSQKRQAPQQAGFLWVTNHLLTKKWRSNACGDDAYKDALFADFKKLCSNEDGRLDELVAVVTGQQKTPSQL